MSHTPGPWKAINDHPDPECKDIFYIKDAKGREIATLWNVQNDDPFLMAAAPELLEALKAIRSAWPNQKHPALLLADKAIAKAKGVKS